MNRRQDAYKALQELKNFKLHGSTIKVRFLQKYGLLIFCYSLQMAWAPGRGMKGKEFKDYWEVDLGASYIPYDRLPDNIDLDLLEDGGMIDDDTIPEKLQGWYP